MRNRLEGLSNKSFAFECLRLLEGHNVPIEIIRKLTDADYCKDHFKSVKAILKEVGATVTTDEIYDGTSKPRFYSEVCYYQDYRFLITNYWYGPQTQLKDNRTPFMEWVLSYVNR